MRCQWQTGRSESVEKKGVERLQWIVDADGVDRMESGRGGVEIWSERWATPQKHFGGVLQSAKTWLLYAPRVPDRVEYGND